MSNPSFPRPTRINGRVYFGRYEFDQYKYAVLGLGKPPSTSGPDELVPAAQAAKELGVGRRTLGRRIAEFSEFDGSGPAAKRLAEGREKARTLTKAAA